MKYKKALYDIYAELLAAAPPGNKEPTFAPEFYYLKILFYLKITILFAKLVISFAFSIIFYYSFVNF